MLNLAADCFEDYIAPALGYFADRRPAWLLSHRSALERDWQEAYDKSRLVAPELAARPFQKFAGYFANLLA